MNTPAAITKQIRTYIESLDFDEYRIAPVSALSDTEIFYLDEWIKKGYEADMAYMRNNRDKRVDPTKLVDNAKSILTFALNYYPEKFQENDKPQIAYYAYGKDYHDVVKDKLKNIFEYIQKLDPSINGRFFCDTAPVLERYWASKSKLGWIGKNSMLIIPNKGSYFFLGTIILDTLLVYDDLSRVKMPSCVNCTRCVDACPTKAIVSPYQIDSNKCLSYQTIENKDDLMPEFIAKNLNNRFYGCDICQQVCPWNRFANPNKNLDFSPNDELLSLSLDEILSLSIEKYQKIFKGSAMKRAKLKGLKRNAHYLKINKNENN